MPAVLERIRREIVSNFPADAALTARKKRGFSVCSVAGSRSRDYQSNPHFQCGIALKRQPATAEAQAGTDVSRSPAGSDSPVIASRCHSEQTTAPLGLKRTARPVVWREKRFFRAVWLDGTVCFVSRFAFFTGRTLYDLKAEGLLPPGKYQRLPCMYAVTTGTEHAICSASAT